MEFNHRLRSLRKEKGLTQTEVGKHLGYGYTTISNYESGRNEPSIEDLKKMAAFFQVSLDYLLGVTDQRQATTPNLNDPVLNRVCTLYSKLDEKSRKELTMLLQWLEFRQNSEEPAEGTTLLRVAQNVEPYDPGKPTPLDI